jgi:Helicase associated domain
LESVAAPLPIAGENGIIEGKSTRKKIGGSSMVLSGHLSAVVQTQGPTRAVARSPEVPKKRRTIFGTKLTISHNDGDPPVSSQSAASGVELQSSYDADDTTWETISTERPRASQSTKENTSVFTSRPRQRQAATAAMCKLAAAAAGPTKPSASTKKRKAAEVREARPPSKRQAKSNEGMTAAKEAALETAFPPSWGDLSKIRVLKPVLESVDFDAVGEQVKVEFAELCQSDQPDDPSDCSWAAKANCRFETGFVDFLAFRKIYGHTLVPKLFPERPSLGRWVQEARQWKTSNRQDRLSSLRMNRLNEAGFVWDAAAHPLYRIALGTSKQSDERWEKKFHQLQEYKAKNGHCNVPKEDLHEKVPAVRACYRLIH